MTEAVLRTHSLSRRFGGVRAVDDVSLTVPSGEILGLIGPNGAGKSTVLNLISGHLRPDGGTVLLAGRDITGRRPWQVARAGLGRTFQITKPLRGLRVIDSVATAVMYRESRMMGVRRARILAEAVLARVGLAARAGASPAVLSTAEVRMLELARALALRPQVLLLDEMMAGLRGAELENACELVRELNGEGMAVVLVEHLMRVIARLADTLAVLHQGGVMAQGPPEAVLRDPTVVAAYLGQRYARRQGGRDVAP